MSLKVKTFYLNQNSSYSQHHTELAELNKNKLMRGIHSFRARCSPCQRLMQSNYNALFIHLAG